MRTQSRIMFVGGVLFLVAGIPALIWAITSGSIAALGVGLAAGTFIVVGAIFLFSARYMRQLDTSDTIADGIAGSADVLSVRDTGVTVSGHTMVMKARVRVTLPGEAPYEGEIRVPLGRTQYGVIQPGMTIPVKVDRGDRSRIVLDPGRSVTAPMPIAGGPGAGMPIVGAPGQQVVTKSAADIIAQGTPTTGVLHGIEPTGLVAGSVAAGLPAEHADDPIMKVDFTYAVDGGQRQSSVLVRVPDGKLPRLVPGSAVAVRYLAADPTTATLDWDRI